MFTCILGATRLGPIIFSIHSSNFQGVSLLHELQTSTNYTKCGITSKQVLSRSSLEDAAASGPSHAVPVRKGLGPKRSPQTSLYYLTYFQCLISMVLGHIGGMS